MTALPPPPQEGKPMNLMQYLKSADPDSIIYLAAKESSSFVMIGTPETLMQDFDTINDRIRATVKASKAKLKIKPDSVVPLEDREVVDTHYRTTDIPGTVVIVTGKSYGKSYWFKHEYDESLGRDSLKMPVQKKLMSDSGYDKLREAIVKQAVVDYMNPPSKKNMYCTEASIEAFFRSAWFKELNDMDGNYLIETLRKEKKKKGGKQWKFDEH